MKHSFFRDSKCIGSWLHRYNIVAEYEDGVLENCEICHKCRFFKLIDGKPDNQAYMNSHIRNALPAKHPYYFHEFEFNPENIESLYV
jgi:hypothetical protein